MFLLILVHVLAIRQGFYVLSLKNISEKHKNAAKIMITLGVIAIFISLLLLFFIHKCQYESLNNQIVVLCIIYSIITLYNLYLNVAIHFY